ncbi:hypothetical protein BDZ45DRAFT_746583 [Acephala macrosclerotiorum]|nr:hypothetical protein BDZ45DRAFT_746583 [Acephala macrosclerotiorum]
MRHSMAHSLSPIMFMLIIMLLVIQATHGLPEVQAIKPQPLIATQHTLSSRQTSSQMNPSNILWPPNCATLDSNCLGQSAVKSCTVKDCSKMVALTCWNHVYYIDFSCLCKSMSSSTCPSCSSGINKELYLAWLAVYCPLDPGWSGLSSNWAGVPEYKILEAGEVNAVKVVDSSHFQTENPFTSQFITDKHTLIDDHHLPSCTSGCQWLNGKWNASFVDGNVAAGLAGAGVFQPSYKIGGVPQSGNLYVDLSVFCPGWKWSDLQSNCGGLCNANLEPTSLLLWLNTTCGQLDGFIGMPDRWTDSLAVVNNTFSNASFPGPSCSQASSDSGCQITSSISSCTRELCGSVDVNGDCQAEYLVNMPCFCSQVKYSSCIASTGPCNSSMQETGLLLWMNNTCGTISGFPGMPSNWTKSLNIANSSYAKVDSFPWPGCLSAGNHSD